MARRPSDELPAKLAAELQDRIRSDMAWVLSEAPGRRFVWRLFEMTGIFRSSFTGNSETFFNEGKRVIGTTLFADVHEAAPEQFLAMRAEAEKQRASDALAAHIEREDSDG